MANETKFKSPDDCTHINACTKGDGGYSVRDLVKRKWHIKKLYMVLDDEDRPLEFRTGGDIRLTTDSRDEADKAYCNAMDAQVTAREFMEQYKEPATKKERMNAFKQGLLGI